ncbi:MAG: hypothetical protein ACPLOC_03765 [Candidatus Bathyarchaeales archaeon]
MLGSKLLGRFKKKAGQQVIEVKPKFTPDVGKAAEFLRSVYNAPFGMAVNEEDLQLAHFLKEHYWVELEEQDFVTPVALKASKLVGSMRCENCVHFSLKVYEWKDQFGEKCRYANPLRYCEKKKQWLSQLSDDREAKSCTSWLPKALIEDCGGC